MRDRILTVLIILSSAPFAAAQTTLSEAVQRVLSSEPGIEAGRAEVSESQATLRQSQFAHLPQLIARGDFTRGDDPVYVFGALLRERDFGPRNFAIASLNNPGFLSNWSSGLELGMPLFTGFSLSSQDRISRLALEQSRTRLDAAAQRIREEAVEAFLEVLWQRELLESLDETMASAQADVDGAKRLRERGMVLGSDYEGALAILGSLKMRRIQAAKALKGARESLAILMKADPRELDVAGRLSEAAYPSEPLDAVLSRALDHRPELQDADLAQSMAQVQKRRETLSFLPQVSAFGSIEADSSELTGGAPNRIFGVRASLPIGDPTYWPRRERAEARWRASRSLAEQSREAVELEVTQAYERLQGALENLPVAKETLGEAKASLDLFHPLYREGRQSILEVLRAQQGESQADAAYLETLYQVHRGRARLWAAEGVLDERAVAEIEASLKETHP